VRSTLALFALGAAVALACTSDTSGGTAPPAAEPRAHLRDLKGSVKVKRAAGDDWVDATAETPLFENDKVKTGPDSSAFVAFSNGSHVALGEEALVSIAETSPRPGLDRTDVTVLQGRIDAELDDAKQSLSVSTPSATVRAGREIVFQ